MKNARKLIFISFAFAAFVAPTFVSADDIPAPTTETEQQATACVDPTITQFLGATPKNVEAINQCFTEHEHNAIVAAEAATLSYAGQDGIGRHQEKKTMLADVSFVPQIGQYLSWTPLVCKDNIIRGFVATKMVNGEKICVVAFRGTADFADCLSDAWGVWATLTSCGQKLRCHRGVYNLYKEMQEQAIRGINNAFDSGASRIIVTGHSLGGGLAGRAALDLKDKFPDKKQQLYTFSSLALFSNKETAQKATDILGNENVVRYDPPADIVPKVGCLGLSDARIGIYERSFSVVSNKNPHNLNHHCADLRLWLINKYNQSCKSRETVATLQWDRATKNMNKERANYDRAAASYQQACAAKQYEQANHFASLANQSREQALHWLEMQKQATIQLQEVKATNGWTTLETPNLMEWTMKREIITQEWEAPMSGIERTLTGGYGGGIPSQELDSPRLETVRRLILRN